MARLQSPSHWLLNWTGFALAFDMPSADRLPPHDHRFAGPWRSERVEWSPRNFHYSASVFWSLPVEIESVDLSRIESAAELLPSGQPGWDWTLQRRSASNLWGYREDHWGFHHWLLSLPAPERVLAEFAESPSRFDFRAHDPANDFLHILSSISVSPLEVTVW